MVKRWTAELNFGRETGSCLGKPVTITTQQTIAKVAFAMQRLLTFFQQKNIDVFTIFQNRNFNVTLAKNFVKF